jgi:putative nucleotidyltransferase with HDIG domain
MLIKMKINFILKVISFSFIITLLTSSLAGYYLTAKIRQRLYEEKINQAKQMLAVVKENLSRKDFRHHHLSKRKQSLLSRLAGPNVLKIWAKEKKLLFSNSKKVNQFNFTEDLNKALGGQSLFQETHSLNDDNANQSPKANQLWLEVYTPIKFNLRIIGAFELYFSLNEFNAKMRLIYIYTYLFTIVGFLAIWSVLSGSLWSASATIQHQNIELKKLAHKQLNALKLLEKNYLGTMQSLVTTLEAKDPYTSGHTSRTSYYCQLIANELKLSAKQKLNVERAALLHDLGKIGTPESILFKKTNLSEAEWAVLKEHPVVGSKIVASVPFLAEVAPIIRHHHERYDGCGYPDGLAGKQIPLESRILAVADAFDALTSSRSYRQALPAQLALKELRKNSGTQFDPLIVAAFAKILQQLQPQEQHLKQPAFNPNLLLEDEQSLAATQEL